MTESVKKLKASINSWEDIAAACGVDPVKCLPYPDPKDSDEISHNAFKKITLTTRLFNGGKGKVDHNNGMQEKWFPWFIKGPSGFGFDGANAGYVRTYTFVGPRLEFLDEEICEWFCKHPELSKIYIEFLSE